MIRRPHWLSSWRRLTLLVSGILVVLVAGAGALVYFVIFPTSSPKAFSITGSDVPATTTAAASTPTQTTSISQASGQTAQLATRWTIGSGSQAGYRVREKLGFLPAESDAVGRTSSITGSLTLSSRASAATITAASFSANLQTLKSDRTMRDQRIHEIGLQSDTYPRGSFTLTKPVTMTAAALAGGVEHATATGNLSIHGQTHSVTIPIEISHRNGKLELVGSLTFPWSKFGMTAPSVAGFVNVSNKATMEFDLLLVAA